MKTRESKETIFEPSNKSKIVAWIAEKPKKEIIVNKRKIVYFPKKDN
jgi:hypothetical protein